MDTTHCMNSSAAETFEIYYCGEITTIKINLAREHSVNAELNVGGKSQSLLAAHEKIDVKIKTAAEENIKNVQKEAKILYRKRLTAKQFQKRCLARLESTGERVKLVEEKTKHMKKVSTDIKAKQEEVDKKLKQNAQQKQKCEEFEKRIATLKRKIKEFTKAPEPEVDNQLVEENTNLKTKIKHYKEQFKLKQIKSNKLRELKNEKTELLHQIQEKRKDINLCTVQLDEKKNYLNEKENTMRTTFLQMRQKISEKSEALHQLQQDYEETNQRTTSLKSKIDELRSVIPEREVQLQNVRDNLTTQMHSIFEEKVIKQKQYDMESDKMKKLENELQDALKDNEMKLKAIMENSNQLYQLKEEKEELMGKIYTQKNLATIRQHELTDERNKLNVIAEKYILEQKEVTILKNKHQTLTEKIHTLNIELDILFVQEKEGRQTLEVEFGKMHELEKQIELKNANIHILTECELEPALKKIDELQQEINDIEKRKNAAEICHKWLTGKVEQKQKELKNDKSFVFPKPESASVQNKSLVEDKNEATQSSSGRKSPGIVKAPLIPQQAKTPKRLIYHRSGSSIAENRPKKVNTPPVMEKNVVEAESEDNLADSGRRSPGILKLPSFKPQNVQTGKRVTFHGVPSSDSSSASNVDDGTKKTGEDLDNILKEWSEFSSTKCK